MMNLKIVMHPQTREIIQIDADEEANWQSIFLHRNTGMPFEGAEVGVEMVAASDRLTVLETPDFIVTANMENIYMDTKESTEEVEMTLEEIQAKYMEVTGKKLSPAYKNNREWLLAKINS